MFFQFEEFQKGLLTSLQAYRFLFQAKCNFFFFSFGQQFPCVHLIIIKEKEVFKQFFLWPNILERRRWRLQAKLILNRVFSKNKCIQARKCIYCTMIAKWKEKINGEHLNQQAAYRTWARAGERESEKVFTSSCRFACIAHSLHLFYVNCAHISNIHIALATCFMFWSFSTEKKNFSFRHRICGPVIVKWNNASQPASKIRKSSSSSTEIKTREEHTHTSKIL